MRIRDRVAALTAAVGVGLVLATAGASAASAHDTLEQSDPAANATVQSLDAVTLTFSADPLGADGAAVIQVIGPGKRYYETACPDLEGPEVSSPVALGASGTYEVLWRVVSSDGHPISGSYTFAYAPDGSATTATPGATAPAVGAVTASAAGSVTPKCGPAASTPGPVSNDPLMQENTSGLWWGLGIGAVVLVGAGIGAWALARGRRGRD